MIRKFKYTVTRIDEYEIDIDDFVINEEWMQEFRENMYDFMDLEHHAKHLAQYQARIGNNSFIEGYGHVMRNNKFIITPNHTEFFEHAININIIDEDNYCDVELKEE